MARVIRSYPAGPVAERSFRPARRRRQGPSAGYEGKKNQENRQFLPDSWNHFLNCAELVNRCPCESHLPTPIRKPSVVRQVARPEFQIIAKSSSLLAITDGGPVGPSSFNLGPISRITPGDHVFKFTGHSGGLRQRPSSVRQPPVPVPVCRPRGSLSGGGKLQHADSLPSTPQRGERRGGRQGI